MRALGFCLLLRFNHLNQLPMKPMITFAALVACAFSFAQTVALEPFATGLNSPVEVVNAGDSRLFIVQQGGAIRIANPDGTLKPNNFLTLTTATISTGGERGLLGLAFHPQYASNGFFYVNYTRAGDGATVIARYSVNPNNPDAALTTGTVLLTVDQPYSNHNGGTLRFGPDGYLYIGMGDGGSGGDPGNRAQNINNNLGKMLRIDVDSTTGSLPYGIPGDNPYVGVAGNDEIWAIGLRNPWKFSFDHTTNELWIADVGQGAIEEINRVSGSASGLNYGWKCYEGNNVYTAGCAQAGTTYTFPVVTYGHTGGACSVTGGYVYRGSQYPNLQGKYIFADYCVNRIGLVDPATNNVSYSTTFSGQNYFTSFGEDVNGEIYAAASGPGTIFKIVDTSLSTRSFAQSGFVLYPNPTTSEFYLKIPETAYPAKISINDLSGKVLHEQNVSSAADAITGGQFQSGIYLVKVTDNTGASASSKLAIN